jgi:hypothetical protein
MTINKLFITVADSQSQLVGPRRTAGSRSGGAQGPGRGSGRGAERPGRRTGVRRRRSGDCMVVWNRQAEAIRRLIANPYRLQVRESVEYF